jgi:hypothetical protein
MYGAVLARLYAGTHQTEAAATLLHELTHRDLSDWHVDEEWLASICLLAETCAILDDAESAGSLYELLMPYGSQNASPWSNSRSTRSAGRSASSRPCRVGSRTRRDTSRRRCE